MNYSIKNNWLTFVCDYTGKYTYELRSYYNKILKNHVNHIIYGFIANDDAITTCSIDTTSINCLFVNKPNEQFPEILNPFAYENDNFGIILPDILNKLEDENDKKIFKYQLQIFYNNKKRELSQLYYSINAVNRSIKNSQSIKISCYTNYTSLFENIGVFKSGFNERLFDEQEYVKCLNLLIQEYFNNIKKYVYIMYHEDTEHIVNNIIDVLQKEKDFNEYYSKIKSETVLTDDDVPVPTTFNLAEGSILPMPKFPTVFNLALSIKVFVLRLVLKTKSPAALEAVAFVLAPPTLPNDA